jgi:hypothetical protein
VSPRRERSTARGRRFRHARIALPLLLVLVVAGCKVDTTVTVDMHDDGSGVVHVDATLDPSAVQAAEVGGGKLQDRVRLGDLESAGWTVGPWRRKADGSASIRLSKSFDTPEDVSTIIDEISGTVGPLQHVTAVRDRGALATRYRLSGDIDLTKLHTGIASDSDLVGRLTGQQIDVAALDAALAQQLQDAVSVHVVARLPGRTTSVRGEPGKNVAFSAQSKVLDTRRIVLLVIAAILLLVAVVVLLKGRRRRRRAPEPNAA